MIIDVQTQIWSTADQLGPELAERVRARQSDRLGAFDGSMAAHEAAAATVDGSLVFGFRADRLGAHVPNELVADFVRRNPLRRGGIAGIDPMAGDATAQLDAAIGMGFVGVTVAPASQGFHPAHSEAMRLYERCAAAGLPLFVMNGEPHAASAMLEFARPHLWDEVARSIPSLRIVITQLGHPWIDETLVLLAKQRGVYADIAGVASRPWQLYNALHSAAGMRVMDKLLFASGFPRETPAKVIEALYTVNAFAHGTQLPAVPRSLIRGIIERDALACLGIDGLFEPQAAPRAAATPELRTTSARAESNGSGD
jgi:uncharacterized protein